METGVRTRPVEATQPQTGETCPNCMRTAAPGAKYCAGCGQRLDQHLLSLRTMIAEMLDDQLALNGRLPRTLVALLFRPGFLTREYTAGRIARYIRPLRLYLTCSLLFFVVLSTGTDSRLRGFFDTWESKTTAPAAGESGDAPAAEAPSEAPTADVTGDAPPPEAPSEATAAEDPVGAADGGAVPDPRVRGQDQFAATVIEAEDGRADPDATAGEDRGPATPAGPAADPDLPAPSVEGTDEIPESVKPFIQPFLDGTSADRRRALQLITMRVLSDAPKAIFLLLPFFALVLKGLYIRSGRPYVEHFIFVLHLHAFAFLFFTLLFILPAKSVAWLWFPVYLVWAMRRMYGQSLLKTLFKFSVFSWTYAMAVLVTLMATFIIAAIGV